MRVYVVWFLVLVEVKWSVVPQWSEWDGVGWIYVDGMLHPEAVATWDHTGLLTVFSWDPY